MYGSKQIDRELIALILRLRGGGPSKGGMTFPLISERLSLSESYVRKLYGMGQRSDPTLVNSYIPTSCFG